MNAHRAKFTSPFAPLQLSDTDVSTLQQLSRTIVSNYVTQYEQYALQGAGAQGVDKRIWKPVKHHRGVCVFAQRKSQTEEDPMDEIRQSIDSFTGSGAVQPSDLPVMLTVGSIPGTLDDVMYGLMCPTIEDMRVKTSYIDDQVADVAVLQTITVPTLDDPYQSLVIKWAHNRLNLLRRSLISYRDFVYMVRTGIVHTSTGERLGFHLMHSVHFPQTHELPPIQRGNMSVCGLYRDNPERTQVEVFARGIMDPRGSAPQLLIIQAAADMFISVAKNVECSYHKKLMWQLRLKQRTESSSSSSSDKLSFSSDKRDLQCTTCKRMPSKVLRILGDPLKRRCALCAKYVCSSCRIKKTLSHLTCATSKLWRREFAFCGACFSEACRSDAFSIALHEFVLLDANKGDSRSFREDFDSFTSSSVCA